LGLGQVKPSDVQGFILTLRESGKAESTVRQVYTVLRAIFESDAGREVARDEIRPGVPLGGDQHLPAELAAVTT
jgi:hypothetical protein